MRVILSDALVNNPKNLTGIFSKTDMGSMFFQGTNSNSVIMRPDYISIYILAGSPPATLAGLTPSNVHTNGNVLIRISSANDQITPYETGGLRFGVRSSGVNAAATGVAGWFILWDTVTYGAASSVALETIPCVWGTVGLPNSGADLEISDVNIVAGQQYTSSGVKVVIPQVYNW